MRKNYLLYPGKICIDEAGEKCLGCLSLRMKTVDRELSFDRGDSLRLRAGARRMEAKVYYGEETRKALANFGPGVTPPRLIAAYAKVKRAAVAAVQEVEGRFDPELFACLIDALDEIAAGKHDDQFPLSIRQGGAGTSFNMNLNEVAAAEGPGALSGTAGKRGASPGPHRGREPSPVHERHLPHRGDGSGLRARGRTRRGDNRPPGGPRRQGAGIRR